MPLVWYSDTPHMLATLLRLFIEAESRRVVKDSFNAGCCLFDIIHVYVIIIGMGKRIDLSNKKIGRWTVVESVPMGKGEGVSYWLCRCECGVEKRVNTSYLVRGVSLSCGCLRREKMRERYSSAERMSQRYPLEYKRWLAMKTRCFNENHPTFKSYGAKGITVCERWKNSFKEFLKDMGPVPGIGYSIERLDNSKGYSPENCLWANRSQQQRNRSSVKFHNWKGVDMTLTEICRKENVNYLSTYQLVRKGRSVEDAVEIVRLRRKPFIERSGTKFHV